MAKRKTPEAPLTIVAAYKQLDEILNNYRSQIEDTATTVEKIELLNDQCKNAGIPINLSITEEDLNETGLNPTPEPSYQSSYVEPDPSTSSSY